MACEVVSTRVYVLYVPDDSYRARGSFSGDVMSAKSSIGPLRPFLFAMTTPPPFANHDLNSGVVLSVAEQSIMTAPGRHQSTTSTSTSTSHTSKAKRQRTPKDAAKIELELKFHTLAVRHGGCARRIGSTVRGGWFCLVRTFCRQAERSGRYVRRRDNRAGSSVAGQPGTLGILERCECNWVDITDYSSVTFSHHSNLDEEEGKIGAGKGGGDERGKCKDEKETGVRK